MQSEQLYAQILGILSPWSVTKVELDPRANQVRVKVELDPDEQPTCPECAQACPRHDTRERSWRHLDTCQMQTILVADVPRADCPEHGVLQMSVPWSGPNSRLTAMFEALVIDCLRKAPTSSVASMLRLTWSQVDGVMQRAVRRGLERRVVVLPRRIGVDETSFQKRHEYVTVVHDLDSGKVLHVADGRGKQALLSFFAQFSVEQLMALEVIAMDMHAPYIAAVEEAVPFGRTKIAFDKFHVAALFSKAIDEVRREEHRELSARGDRRLAGSRYQWLRNPTQMLAEQWARFKELREAKLKTARAWAIKETAMEMWDVEGDAGVLERGWRAAMRWAGRSRLEPMKRLAKTVRAHLEGIILAQLLGVTNARAEGINSTIQKLKRSANGFRNRERFRVAILFHRGGLDLYPIAC